MRRHASIRCAWALLVLGGVVLRPALAAPPVVALGGTLQARVELAPVRLDELGARPVEALAGVSRQAHAVGGRLVVDAAIATPPIRLVVQREIPALWRWHVGKDAPALPLASAAPVVRLLSQGGFDHFAHATEPAQQLPVRVRMTPPRTIASDAQGQVLESGVVLEIDLGRAARAGRYIGELVIDPAIGSGS
jgi:hypothetical protein